MKLRDGFSSIFAFGKSAAEMFSHLNTATDIVGALAGREPSSGAEVAKGIYGFFGHADERDFVRFLRMINRGNREILIGFLRWQFPRKTNDQKLVAMYFGNRFRTFIVKMGEADALRFLGGMAGSITKAGGRTKGYRAVRSELIAQNVPLPPDDASVAVKTAREGVATVAKNLYQETKVAFRATATAIDQKVADERAKSKPLFNRLIRWI